MAEGGETTAADSDLTEAIQQAAAAPVSATVDGQTVTQQKLTDIVEADRYLSSKKAMKSGRGFRLTKMVPHGTV